MNQIYQGLIKVLREFGIVGLVTYVGGVVILLGFLQEEKNLNRQILFGVVGLILLIISTFIAYFRIQIQRDREQALIDMVKNTGNRLAEQVAKNLSNEQVAAIIQKIRQNQRDLITTIIGSDNKNKML
jgi:hypothetical protein